MELKENRNNQLWYKDVAYEDAKELVKENLVNTVAAFIASGYWLKYIRDSRDYERDGYQSLWDCAEKEFGLKISEASRAMSMNDKYSIDGNTPFMSESYKRYNKSQLQEMLTMSDEQIEQVTPDMTIKDIREIKKPKTEDSEENQEELKDFIHNFVQFEYPALMQLEAAGISIKRLQEVFDGKLSSHKLIWFIMLGDEESELVDADTGEILEKYSSNTVIDMLSSCFIQTRERKTRPLPPEVKGLMDDPYCSVCGSPLNSPRTDNMSLYCTKCGQAVDWTEYIKRFCDVATDTVNTECEDELAENIYTEIEDDSEAEEPLNVEFDTDELMQELEDEEAVDAEYREVEDSVEVEPDAQEAGAAEKEDVVEAEQPALPKFRNNEQRKAWIEDVEAWGLWYEDHNIQARYYKYDFPDGSRLIAVKYRYTCPPWMKNDRRFSEADGSYKDAHYHMIYSEEYKKSHKYEYENYYVHSTVSISALVEFIKEIAKRVNEHE